MPANFWASSVASSWTTSTMSSTVTMPFILPFMSTTGMTVRSCSAKIRDTVSWSISSVTSTTSVSMTSATTFLGLAAQVADRLVGGHVGAQPGVAGRHQAAGLVLLVGEQRGDLLAGRCVEQREQLVAVALAGLLDHVGSVVGLQQAQPLATLAGPEVEQQGGLVAGRQRDEEVLGLV